MKILGSIMITVTVIGIVFGIWSMVHANYQWDNEVLSYWNLSDKSSTLQAKAEYMDKFISALENGNLADNNALIYKTNDNNCGNNVEAIRTLRNRLDQIKGMDESSFQYQQAIQQITSQEQGEADKLMETLRGCWYKTHHYFLWNIFIFLGALLSIIIIGGVGILFINEDN